MDLNRLEIREPAPGELGWIIAEHARHYVLVEAFDPEFERVVAEVLVNFLTARDPEREKLWVASFDGAPVGSLLCAEEGEDARLRLFFIHSSMRGKGLGRVMLDHGIAHARGNGFARVMLSTHAEHEAACRLYAKAGFVCEDTAPSQAFGRLLNEQTWVLGLGE